MKTLLAISVLLLVSVTVNAQSPATKQNQFIGQTFDEIVVSSDLSVKRTPKENRQGKQLTNVPSGTTSPPGKSTALASRLVFSDGSSVIPERRKKRGAQAGLHINTRLSEQGQTKYLLRSRQL